MDAPGVELKPIHMYDHQYTVNEVHLRDVRVPADELIGEENKGWDYAKFLLSRERGMVAQSWLIRHEVERAKAFARDRSEEHTSELQSLMRISYAVFCLKKKKPRTNTRTT